MKNKLFQAGSIILVFYFASQGIRLVANIYVANLLAPEMFGIMATVFVLQQGVSMLSDIGLDSYIIRHNDYKNPKLLNNIWTIQVIRGAGIATVILLIGLGLYFIQCYFVISNLGVISERQLPFLIFLSASMPLFMGFRSMARLVNTRELNRLKLSIIQLISQISGVVAMLAWAYLSPSVWALAIAGPVSMFVMLLLDYILFALRHRLSFDRMVISEVYHFGKWIFLSTTLTYLSSQGDKLFLSFTLDPREFGLYAIALSLIGFMLTIIQNFSNQLWLPYFSENKLNHAKLKVNYYKVRLMQDALVLIGIVAAIYVIPPLIYTLYDERYAGVSSLLILLLPLAISVSINETSKALLITVGETKVQMTSVFVRTVLLIVLLPTMFSIWGLQGVILATIISSFSAFIPQVVQLYRSNLLSPTFEVVNLLFVVLVVYMILEKVYK